MFRFRRLHGVLTSVGAVALLAVAIGATAQAATPRVKVMTRNMYIGTDLTPVVQATTFEQFVTETARAFTKVQASDPPERIKALAREIADADPMILGLQEVQLVERDTEAPTNDGPATPATTVVFDFLELLLDELAAGGTPYTVVTSATNVSAEVPTALGFDVRATDRDVLLARSNLPADELSWSNAGSANFEATLTFQTVAGPLAFTRGFNAADFTANKRSFRLVNTHLEAFSSFFRNAQAVELLSGVLGDGGTRSVLIGDINSDPRDDGTNAYDIFADAGFADSWTQANPLAGGLTCCFGELLLDTSASVFDSRIDVVLTRNARSPSDFARVYGTDADNRTPSGRWPSDHAGVSARIAP